jgi:hypothetical protein
MARKVAGRGGGKRKGVTAAQSRKRAARAKGRDDRSDYKNVRRAEKVEAAQKKDGCLPKLFMLALPFLAVGAFFIARL